MLLSIAFEVMLAEVMIRNTPAAVFRSSLYIYNNVCCPRAMFRTCLTDI